LTTPGNDVTGGHEGVSAYARAANIIATPRARIEADLESELPFEAKSRA